MPTPLSQGSPSDHERPGQSLHTCLADFTGRVLLFPRRLVGPLGVVVRQEAAEALGEGRKDS